MRRLVELCLRHRAAVAILALLALVYGGISAFRVPLDVLPEFVSPQLSIQTEAPGLTPGQVELSVTRAVEAAVNGAPGLAALRSESIAGLSVVNLSFAADADVQAARQGVAERLAALGGTLPQGVFPVAGLCLGHPADDGRLSMRLPLAVTVHTDRYDASGFDQQLAAYDARRAAREPTADDKQKYVSRWGVVQPYTWSEDKARQYSVPERHSFGDYVRGQGFALK